MGTWGTKTFENDDALDWAGDLEKTKGATLLESSLSPSEVNEYYLEAPDCVRILCAAEVIVGVVGQARPALPENISTWIAKNKTVKSGYLVPLAIDKVQRVLAKHSELDELWAENQKDYPIWKKDVSELLDILKRLSKPPQKPWWRFWRNDSGQSANARHGFAAPELGSLGSEITKGKRRKQVDRGDIICIPAGNGHVVFAMVCWASDRYKNVIQIVFLANNTEESLQSTLNFIEPTIFTGAQEVHNGRWRKLFSHQQLYTPFPPVFYSAGAVCRGDEYLREATDEERRTLLGLCVLGAALVEKKAAEKKEFKPSAGGDGKPAPLC